MSIPDPPPVAEGVRTIARFPGALAIILAAACSGTAPVTPATSPSTVATPQTTAAPAPQPTADPAPAPAPLPAPSPAPSPAPAVIRLASFTVSPQELRGGDPTTGTVTLDSVAPGGGFVVTLSSESKDGRPPDSVIVPAGSKSATVTIDTASVSGTTEARINATAGGVTLSVLLRLKAGPPPPPPEPFVPTGRVTVSGKVG